MNNIIICYSETSAPSLCFGRMGIIKHSWALDANKREGNSQTETDLRLPSSRWGGEGWTGSRDQQMRTIIYEMGKRKGPTTEHRKLYPISWDKPSWERMWKRICIYTCITKCLCCKAKTQHCTSTLFQLNTFKRKKLENICLLILFICIVLWHILVKHDTIKLEVIGKMHKVL